MDIHDFTTFLEVSRTRHFGQAARNLCITQSTVSARIRQLEQQLGTPLFIRERNNIQLTPAGEKMLGYAEMITTAWNRARQEVGMSQAGKLPLSIGGIVSLWDILLQQWIQQLHQQHSELALQGETHGNEVLIRRTLSNTLDIAVVFDAPQNDHLVVRELATIKLVLIASRPGSAADTLLQDYILVDWGTSFLTRHAQEFPEQPMPSLRIGQGRIALDFILNCGGSAYLAEQMVQPYLDEGRLHRIEDAPVIERSAYAVYNNQNEKAKLIEQLLTEMPAY
ncbi:MAG: LysR family transcriptional regulator [Thiohalophilus sp.]|uniref:LysR family transcriptional regulator n=1 Tax=Thiohalophilus sp. TaxID=3028392 RepID=UPI00286FE42C|nr:LysR family transcriptional regulator [Thiohalophilus sp.]MDR9436198.1 LysR family transcriptional regulator [Thiohalophilus sp.]